LNFCALSLLILEVKSLGAGNVDIIENIIGFPLSSLNQAEKSYDYATSIIAQDGRLTQMITDLQAHYQWETYNIFYYIFKLFHKVII